MNTDAEYLKPKIRTCTIILIVIQVISLISNFFSPFNSIEELLASIIIDVIMIILFILCLYGLAKNKLSYMAPIRVIIFISIVCHVILLAVIIQFYVIDEILVTVILALIKVVFYIYHYINLRCFRKIVRKEKDAKYFEDFNRKLEENKTQHEVNTSEETNSSEKIEENKQ